MNQRFYSLDIFRGATVALMILVNNPGSWSYIYDPLKHAPWHGCTPTDLVFPFFLFAVGNAMAFVLPKLEAAGESVFWRKITRRALLIFIIGLLLNWFPFIKWEQDSLVFKPWAYIADDGQQMGVRIFGVLQRIAVCYFFASVIAHYFKPRGAFVFSAILLLVYWFTCVAANPADPFSLAGWFGTRIDLTLVGEAHIYKGEGVSFDPEGLMSTPTAIVQIIFGYLAGNYILQKGKTQEMVNGLFVAGFIFLFAAYCWNMVFPINKKIWTSSYTMLTSGLAMAILALLIYMVELKGIKGKWAKFFDVFGKNALFIFVMSGVLPRLLGLVRIPTTLTEDNVQIYTSPLGWFYSQVCAAVIPSDPRVGSFLYALFFIAMMWLLAWILDRKKIYIRV